MFEVLLEIFNSNKIVSIFCDYENKDKNITGYIVFCNNEKILVAHISPRGMYDGFILVDTHDVFRVEYGGAYESKVEKLYNIKKQIHPKVNIDKINVFGWIINFAKENDLLISVVDEYCTTGFIKELSNKVLTLNTINDYGCFDGVSTIEIETIDKILCDTEEEQDVKLLIGDSFCKE